MRGAVQKRSGLCRIARAAMAVIGAAAGAGLIGAAVAAPLPEGNGVSPVAATPRVTSQLVAERDAVAPSKAIRVILDQSIISEWHTYWINPGETGLPTKIKWTLPPGWTADPIQWPTPRKMMVGPIVNYGYEDKVRLISTLHAPADAATGAPATITGEANWLVCQQMCIPERVKLVLPLGVDAGGGAPVAGAAALFRQAQAALPHAGAIKVAFVQDDKGSALAWPSTAKVRDAVFFPDSQEVLATDVGQKLTKTDQGYRLAFAKAPTLGADPLTGILSIDGRGVPIAARPVAAMPDAGTAAAPAASGQPAPDAAATAPATPPTPAPAARAPAASAPPAPAAATGSATMFAWQAALLAALGGVILNLMPCVFPVLSMKAFALARHGQAHARRHGLAYAAGVILCFVAIAAILLALRAAGSQIGWGFQLQSPLVVTALAYVMLLLGLSMSGVFEIGTGVMGVGSDLAGREGLSGSFFTGVLATVVAAPCTAPFMGAAVGYALLQPSWVALAVFAALGVGMALPFVVLTFFDPLLRRIPKPGPWMERLKQILAFPLYATAAWLVWVLAQQTGSAGLAMALGGCLLIAFAAYLYGQPLSGLGRWLWRGVAIASAVAAVAMPLAVPAAPAAGAAQIAQADRPGVFSESAVAAELAAGRPVLVDFTAAWCITCLANEKVALSRSSVKAALQAKNVTFMKADWTNQDGAITVALQKFGRSGVPLYLLYAPGRATPQVLPQLLTEDIVLDALDKLPSART